MQDAVNRAMDKVAIRVQSMLEDTTSTWKHEVRFAISAPSWDKREISTNDEVYGYVNFGTRPHLIGPRNARYLRFASNYTAKTRPGVIGSGPGGPSGSMVFFRGVVMHPGTKPRKFTKEIAKLFSSRLAEAIHVEFQTLLGA